MTDDTPADQNPADQNPADDTEPTLGADEPTVEAAAPAPAPGPAPGPAPAPAASAPAVPPPTPPPSRRRGVFVPAWVAAVIAVLVIGGVGFAIGFALGDDGDSSPSSAASNEPAPTTTLPSSPDRGDGDRGLGVAPTAFLGVAVDDAADDGGARITGVGPNSPAADAGLRAGDVITRVDDTRIEDAGDLGEAIRAEEPGDDVTITYTRDGQPHEVEVELGCRPRVARGIPSAVARCPFGNPSRPVGEASAAARTATDRG